MPNGVARDELAYWEGYLSKTKISLDDARYQGYTALGGTGKCIDDLERSVLGTQLGLSASVLAATSLNTLRYSYYMQQLGNPVKKTLQDLAASFWATSGFAPQFTLEFRDAKTEVTAAAQTKTIANLGLGSAGSPRYIIVAYAYTASAALPASPTLGGILPQDINTNNNGAGRYTAIASYPLTAGTTANFVLDAGVGQTVQDVVAFTYKVNKTTTNVANANAAVGGGANTLSVNIPNSPWKLGDFIVVMNSVQTVNIFDMAGAAPGFVYDITFGTSGYSNAAGSQLMIPNSNPYSVLITYSGAAPAASSAQGVRFRVS